MSDIDPEFVRTQIDERYDELKKALTSTEYYLAPYSGKKLPWWRWRSRRQKRRLKESEEVILACIEAAEIARSFAAPDGRQNGQDLNSALRYLGYSKHAKVAVERYRGGTFDRSRIKPINLDDYRTSRANAPRPPEP